MDERSLWGRGAVGALALMLVIAVACGDDDAATAQASGGEALGGGPAADCMVYDEAVLLAQEIAFDGTLVAGDAETDQATFEVHQWFRGGEGAEIVLAAGGLLRTEAQALQGTTLEVGQRYLISSTDGVVWACGYSATYDTELAAEWAELFG
jgi:hypothetical protein